MSTVIPLKFTTHDGKSRSLTTTQVRRLFEATLAYGRTLEVDTVTFATRLARGG